MMILIIILLSWMMVKILLINQCIKRGDTFRSEKYLENHATCNNFVTLTPSHKNEANQEIDFISFFFEGRMKGNRMNWNNSAAVHCWAMLVSPIDHDDIMWSLWLCCVVWCPRIDHVSITQVITSTTNQKPNHLGHAALDRSIKADSWNNISGVGWGWAPKADPKSNHQTCRSCDHLIRHDSTRQGPCTIPTQAHRWRIE